MEQLNKVLPTTGEETQPAKVDITDGKENSYLLNKVHQNFNIFGQISLFFGVAFAILFYKTGIGINSLAFTIIMVSLLVYAAKRLEQSVSKEIIAYYLAAILLSLSNMLTASWKLQFLNTAGILLLLDVSLIRQYAERKHLEFPDYLGRMFMLPFRSIASMPMPFMDINGFLKKSRIFKNDRVRNILIGTVIAIPILILISALLSSADQLFHKLTENITDMIFSSDPLLIILMVIFGFLVCYTIICGAVKKTGKAVIRVKADPGIALTAASLLFIIYALFCVIQVIYLFAGGILGLPEGFTYSQYARKGFFELLTVTGINLILILVCTNVFRENKGLKIVLTAISGCTYIMIASAVYRMLLYIGAYHLTFLRLLTLLFLLIDAIVLAGVIISIYNRQFPLFGYCVAVVSICYLLFSFSKPDYFIASYLINNNKELEQEDVTFLTRELSFDAAPVVIPLLYEIEDDLTSFYLETETGRWLWKVGFDYNESEMYFYRVIAGENTRDIRDFNLSYFIANMEAEQYLFE